jgi:mRNA interferase MazF
VPARRSEVWLIRLPPEQSEGREQRGNRPAIVVSANEFNSGPAGLLTIVPLTTRRRGENPWHVTIPQREGGLTEQSYAMVEQTRTISADRLLDRLGAVTGQTMQGIEELLRYLLNL